MNDTNNKVSGRIIAAIGALAAVALLSVGVLAGSLFTRSAAAAPGDTTGHAISVAGNGEVRVTPDKADLNFQIHVSGATSDEALAQYEKSAQALTAKLQALGLDTKNIIVQPASTWPIQGDMSASGEKASGYYADGVITATILDLNKLRDVAMDGLKAEQGIGISSIQYGLQDDTQPRADAMNKAIDNARSQADAVASKLGLKVQEVVAVNVQGGFATPMYGKGGEMAVSAASDGANFAQLGSRPDVVINVQVQVSYNFQ